MIQYLIYSEYNPKVDGRGLNAFGAAAFRFGHTLVQDRLRRTDHRYRKDDSLMLSSVSQEIVFRRL